MNSLGKEKIAFMIASVITEIFCRQEEIVSLYWKSECEVSASDSSNEDNIILQEDLKATTSTTVSMEALTEDAAQDKLIYKRPRTTKRQKKPPTIKSDDFFMVKDNQMLGSNSITIFHQNIFGLRGKTDEFISSMSPDFLHNLCFSEHHLKKPELDQINVHGYRLVAAYYRQVVKRGGVCIFVKKT